MPFPCGISSHLSNQLGGLYPKAVVLNGFHDASVNLSFVPKSENYLFVAQVGLVNHSAADYTPSRFSGHLSAPCGGCLPLGVSINP